MPETENEKMWWRDNLIFFGKLSSWVAPIIGFLFIGKWLDEKYQTEPWLLLVSVGTASLVSLFGIIKEAEKSMREAGNNNKKDNKEKTS